MKRKDVSDCQGASQLQHPRKLLLAAARKNIRLFHRVATLHTYTESLQRGEAVLRVRSHGKQCRAGGWGGWGGEASKVDCCRKNISLMGQLASCLWAAGRLFFYFLFFDRSLWSQAPLFSTGWKKSDEKGGWKNINDQHETLWETLSVGTKCVPPLPIDDFSLYSFPNTTLIILFFLLVGLKSESYLVIE